jgi:hypothetical protein
MTRRHERSIHVTRCSSLCGRRPFGVDAEAAARNHLPDGLMRPIVAVPVGDRFRCVPLALYGPHVAGYDLNQDERAMLAELADKAASVFMKLDHDQLCQRIAALECELKTIAAASPRSLLPPVEAKSTVS